MQAFNVGMCTPNSVWFPDDLKTIDYQIAMLNEIVPCDTEPLDEEQIELQRDLSDSQRHVLDDVISKFKLLGDIPLTI